MKQIKIDNKISYGAGIGAGMLVSILTTLLLTAIGAWLIDRGSVNETSINVMVIVIHFISAVFGAWAAYALLKKRRLIVCTGTGVAYAILMICLTALFFGGQYSGITETVVSSTLGGLAVGLLGVLENKHTRTKKWKRRNS